MWQSQIEIKYYSVASPSLMRYNTELLLSGGAYMRFIDVSDIHMLYMSRMSPALSRSSAHASNLVMSLIHNGIIFSFYPGLPRI